MPKTARAKTPKKPQHYDLWVGLKLATQTFVAIDDEEVDEKAIAQTALEAARNQLWEMFIHLVRYNAERIAAKLPAEVQVDDLFAAGQFGLMEAIAAYDPERGIKFETYCAPRIRGSILDFLRSMDWVPRLVRSRTTKMRDLTAKLEAELGRTPTKTEIAKKMNISEDELKKIMKDTQPTQVVSLSRKYFETDSFKDVREIDILEDAKSENPVRALQRKALKEFVTAGLSRAERLIIILYYYEEMTMKQIGATLDLSESRVSQMHSGIILRMKARLTGRKDEFN